MPPKGEKEKERKEEDDRDDKKKEEPAQSKRPNAKEEESDNEVEFLFEVKSTYKTRRQGIMRRRQLKLETEMKAKEKWLRLADYQPRDAYMRWEDMLQLYGPMESDDGEEEHQDLKDAREEEEYEKEEKEPKNGAN